MTVEDSGVPKVENSWLLIVALLISPTGSHFTPHPKDHGGTLLYIEGFGCVWIAGFLLDLCLPPVT